MAGTTLWAVQLYAPNEKLPASNETFTRFEPALTYALTLKRDRPTGWRVQVQPPAHAEAQEIAKLRENALYTA